MIRHHDGEGRLMTRLKFLEHYKPVIVEKLLRTKEHERGALTSLARRIEMDPSRLSEIMGGRRNLTSEYIIKMVGGGFVTVDQLLKGRKVEDLSKDEAEFIDSLRIVEDQEWIRLITDLKKDPRAEKTAKDILKTLIKK